MAEGTSVRQKDVVCRYFLTSSCKNGDRCLFSHDISRRIPDSVCRYYLQGKCVYGHRCRYDHVRVNKESNARSNTHNDRHSTGPSRQSANCEVNCNLRRPDSFNTLTRRNEVSNTNASSSVLSNWLDAPEFVPQNRRSYAGIVKANTVCSEPEKIELCQYFMVGECPFDGQCPCIHGDMCELCQRAILNPYDEKQRKDHIEECEKVLEQDMELSFAVQRSMDKICGICMDVVLEKEPLSERRFGILEKCNHVYCLSCIRKWRSSKQYESNQYVDNAFDPVVTRACPECRIPSDFVTPSGYFIDTEEEKIRLVAEYKKALSQKDCKYFKKGEGICPFGGACFYLHSKSDGTKVELPLPTRRRCQNQDGELDFVDQISLWDYLEHREENAWLNLDFGSDSNDDDQWSPFPQ